MIITHIVAQVEFAGRRASRSKADVCRCVGWISGGDGRAESPSVACTE
jgi:hypothetical protein